MLNTILNIFKAFMSKINNPVPKSASYDLKFSGYRGGDLINVTQGYPHYSPSMKDHAGVDLTSGYFQSDTLPAIEDGEILDVRTGDDDYSGRVVLKGKKSGYTWTYKHAGEYGLKYKGGFLVKKGEKVKGGQALAYPDKSNTNSLHSHLEVKSDEKGAFNPIEAILEIKPDQKFRLSTNPNYKVKEYFEEHHADLLSRMNIVEDKK